MTKKLIVARLSPAMTIPSGIRRETIDELKDMERHVFCDACEASGPTDYDQRKAIELWNTRREPEE